jgi:hypothetical protein
VTVAFALEYGFLRGGKWAYLLVPWLFVSFSAIVLVVAAINGGISGGASQFALGAPFFVFIAFMLSVSHKQPKDDPAEYPRLH